MDLYNIPGDTGGLWRLKKFVEYQHEVPSIHYRMLGEYIKKHSLDKDSSIFMCWYMSCTYNELTCMLLDRLFNWADLTPKNFEEYCTNFWGEFKLSLDFGSARKYAKSMDWFPELMIQFIRTTKKHPYKWIKSLQGIDSENTYYNLCEALERFQFVGRFARDLFMESIMYIQDYINIPIREPKIIDWEKCSNLTSGILNIFYMDEEANLYDKTKRLPSGVSKNQLSAYLKTIQNQITETYPEQDNDINMFVGKICSFRNLFKASRYGGFHHDRELGVLHQYEKTFPELKDLWIEVYELRKSLFPERFLGELNGWEGIRKERKKLWIKEGKTGVEIHT